MNDTVNYATITDEMDWILKILLSCENHDQIKVSEKLFNNFIKKWEITPTNGKKNYISSYNKIKFIVNNRIEQFT
jgi:hypothetical protein